MTYMTQIVHDKKHMLILLLVLLLAAVLMIPSASYAKETEKTVRVGWYETPFNTTDQFGRKSGYAYEYQRKIAAYTGWNYEYVEGTWRELLEMVKNGEIDLMSDVSYTPERAEEILYASLPMGTEAYDLFVAEGNSEITSDDYHSLNGKKIGVTKDSIQKDLFLEWAEKHKVSPKLIETKGSEEDSLQMLQEGKLDAFVTLDTYGDPGAVTPICKIGSSDFFFVVNKERPDLLNELDDALNRIQEEDRYYNEQLFEKYLRSAGTYRYLSTDEKKWLSGHGPIRVGYQDNYLAFCAADKATGELTGALKDYLAYASTGMENGRLDFEAVAYPTASDAIEALQKGDVDCMFPANLTDYDGETLGVVMTPSLMRTEMDAVVREADKKEFIRQKDVTVAVNEGNPNYDLFLKDHYPTWKTKHYKDTPTCLDAVAAGDADCIIISNYRFSNISKQCEKQNLTTVYTGVDMDYCLAVREGDTELYSILTKVTGMVPESTTNAALTYYSTEDAKTSFTDAIRNHLAAVMTVIALVLLVILLLLLRSIRAERKARAEHHMVNDLNRQVFVDSLTSVRNKGAFNNYIEKLQEQVDTEESTEFAIGIFDCNDLKIVNDNFGHDKGDIYLITASKVICRTFQHSPVFRIGGDEFAVVLQGEDYQNRVTLVEEFERVRDEICSSAENGWEAVSVAMGIAVYDPHLDHSVADTARRADKLMYENKHNGKAWKKPL